MLTGAVFAATRRAGAFALNVLSAERGASHRVAMLAALGLALGASFLAAMDITGGLGSYGAQSDNTGNTFTSAPSFVSAGYQSPSAQAATSGGDGDGFEVNPAYAYGDDASHAANAHGPGDRHLYYNYGVEPAAGSTVEGIRLRLDWWVSAVGGDKTLSAELSWDGGTSWTAPQTDTVESATEHTGILGGAADTWGHSWTPSELSDANFRVRLTCNCIGGGECNGRSFYLDWAAANVYYTPP